MKIFTKPVFSNLETSAIQKSNKAIKAAFGLLVFGVCLVTSSASYATNRSVVIGTPPAPTGGAAITQCITPGAYSETAVATTCATAANTVTWQYTIDGFNIAGATNTFTTNSTTCPAVACTGAQLQTALTTFALGPGTHNLAVVYKNSATQCGATSGTSYTSSNLVITVSALTLATPAAPTSGAITCNSIVVNWTAITNATNYELTVGTDPTFATGVVATYPLLVGNVLTKTVTGLTTGTLYYYRLRANNTCAALYSAYSPNGSATTSNPPLAPVLTATTPITCNSGKINWTAATGATNYEVTVSTSPTITGGIISGPTLVGNVVTDNITLLTTNTTYYYYIRTQDACGNFSGYSAIGTFNTSPIPNPPSLNATTAITCNSATVNWAAATSATNYEVTVSTDPTMATGIVYGPTLAGNVVTKNIPGLLVGTTYYYYIRTEDACANYSAYSTIGTFNTTAVPAAPVVGTPATLCSTITLNWSTSTNATNYEVTVSTNPSMIGGIVAGPTLVGNVLTYPLSGLLATTTYYYEIRAVDACSNYSAYSSIGNITTGLATVVSGGSTSLCIPVGSSSATTAFTGTPIGGTWTSVSTAVATVDAFGNVNGVSNGTSVISYGASGCYAIFTETVGLAPANITITPSAATSLCLGSGTTVTATSVLRSPITILAQNFNISLTTGQVPASGSWVVTNTGTPYIQWSLQADGASTLGFVSNQHSNDNTQFLGAFNDFPTATTNYTSPPFSLNGYATAAGSVVLTYYMWHDYIYGAETQTDVQISVNGGAYAIIPGSTNYKGASQNLSNAFGLVTVDLSAYGGSLAGNNNITLRWVLNSYESAWAIDNILVSAQFPLTYAWTATAPATTANLSCTACAATTITPSLNGTNIYSVTANYDGCNVTAGASVFATSGAPTVPVLGASSSTCNTINLNWGGTSGATTFSVTISPNSDMSSPVFGPTSVGNVLSYTATGLAGNTTYYYTVQGSNVCGGAGPITAINSQTTTVTPTLSGGVSTICQPAAGGGSTTWIGAPTGGTWTSSNTAAATISAGLVSGIVEGVTVISYGSGGCYATNTVTVSEAPVPLTITPGNSASVCLGSGSPFTAVSGVGTLTTVLAQNFNTSLTTGQIPTVGAWAVTNSATVPRTPWSLQSDGSSNLFYYTAHSNDNTQFLGAESEFATATTNYTSPQISLNGFSTAAGSVVLTYYMWHDHDYGAETVADVQISVNGGAYALITGSTNYKGATQNLSNAFGLVTVDLSSYAGSLAGNTNIRLRWVLTAYESSWAIDNIKVVGAYPLSYTWSATPPATNANMSCTACAGPNTITPSLNGNNVYSVVSTYNLCTSTSGVTVFATSTAPTVPVISGASSTCNAIKLNWGSGTGATTYSVTISPNSDMSSPVFGPASVGNVLTYTATGLAGNTTYYYVVQGSNLCGGAGPATAVASIPTTVTPGPTGGASALCLPAGAASTTAFAGTPSGGTWSSSNISAATVDASGNVIGFAAGIAVISYGSGGCYATNTVTVSNGPGAIGISPGTTTSLCYPTGIVTTASSSLPPGTVVLAQNFNTSLATGQIPSVGSWVVTNSAVVPQRPWSLLGDGSTSLFGYTTHSNDNTQFLGAETEFANATTNYTSPPFSLTGYNTATGSILLTYYMWHEHEYGAETQTDVQISVNGGAYALVTGSTNYKTATQNTSNNFGLVTVDLSAYGGALAGNNNITLRWVLTSYESSWAIDNINVTALYPLSYAWSATAPALTGDISNIAIAAPTITPSNVNATSVYSVTATYNTCSTKSGISIFSTNQPPTAPVLTTPGTTCGSFTMNWGAGTGATAFNVTISSHSDMSSPFVGPLAVGNVLTYTATGLSQNTPYYYQVQGSNACGGSGPISAIGTATTTVTPSLTGGASILCIPLGTTFIGAPTGGTWSSSNTSAAIVSGGVVGSVGAGTAVISYGSGGCYASSAVTSVNPPTAITISPTTATSICNGSGYVFTANAVPSALVSILAQNFNTSLTTGQAPVGGIWSVANGGTVPYIPWSLQINGSSNLFGNVAHSNDNTTFLGCESDFQTGASTAYVSPAFSLNGYGTAAGSILLTYYMWHDHDYGAETIAAVQISVNGAAYVTIPTNYSGSSQNSSTGFGLVTVDLSAYGGATAGNTNLKLRWAFGGYASAWAIDNISLTAQYSPITYAWSPVAPATTADISNAAIAGPTITPALVGANVYSVVANYNGCTSNAGVTLTTLGGPPAFTTTEVGGFCVGGGGITISVLSSVTGVSYQLVNGATNVGGPMTGTGSTLTFPTQTTAGIYVVKSYYTICPTTFTSSTSYALNSAPTGFSITKTGTLCTGGGVNIGLGTSQAGVSYQLYNGSTPTGSVVAGTGSPIVGAFPLQNTLGTYSVSAVQTTGCPNITGSTNNFTVVTSPTVTTIAPVAICSGTSTSITLTSNIPSTYTWTIGVDPHISNATAGSGAEGSAIIQTLTNSDHAVQYGDIYKIIPTSVTGLCVGAEADITQNVKPAPSLTTTNPTAICNTANTSITLHSSITSTYSWTISPDAQVSNATADAGPEAEGFTISQALGNSDNVAPHKIVYHIVPVSTSGLCTGASTDITQTVNPTPAVTTVNPSAICNNTHTSITLHSSTSASTFVWTATPDAQVSGSSVGGGSDGTIINQLLSNSDNNAPHMVVYSITPTFTFDGSAGCVGPTTAITQTVNPTPSVTTVNPIAICSNTSTSIVLHSTVSSTYNWTVTPDVQISGASASSGVEGGLISQTLQNSDVIPHIVVYHIKPTFTFDGSGGCLGSSTDITQTVNPTPAVTTTNPGSAICSGLTTNLFLTSTTGAPYTTYSWTAGVNPNITGASASVTPEPESYSIVQALTNTDNTSEQNEVFHITPTYTYDGAACAGPATDITQTVNPTPAVATANPAAICNGTSTSIVLTSTTGGSTYNWTINPDAQISGASADGGPEVEGFTITQTLSNSDNNAPHVMVYQVNPTYTFDGATCVGTETDITQTVNPTPLVTTVNQAAICNNTNTSITLTSTSGGGTYSWTVSPDGQISGASAGSGSEGSVISQLLGNSDNTTPHVVVYHITPAFTYDGSAACPGVATDITQTVNPTPGLTTINPNAICSGSSTNLVLTSTTGAPNSTYTWTVGINPNITGASSSVSSEPEGYAIVQALTNTDVAAVHREFYHITPTYTFDGAACAGVATTITQTVNPTVAVTTVNSAAICNTTSTSIVLTSSTGASTYSWTISPDAQISNASADAGPEAEGFTIIQALGNSDNSAPHMVVYHITPTYTFDGSACVGSSTDITQTVNPTPSVTTVDQNAICSGSNTNITLTSTTGASTYTWTAGTNPNITGASGSVTSEAEGYIISQALTNSDNTAVHRQFYHITPTYTFDGAACVGAATTITQTVNPTPSVTTVNPAAICAGTATSIMLTSTTNASTYVWTVSPDAQISGASGGSGSEGTVIAQTLGNSDNSAVHTVVYHITPTYTFDGSGGCAGPTTDITQTVNPSPSVTTVNPAAFCSGSTTNISLTSTSPSTYVWTVTADPQISGSASGTGVENDVIGQALTNSDHVNAHIVVYHIVPTYTFDGSACTGSSTDITQTVNPTPSIDASAPAAICNGMSTSIDLTARTSLSSTFSWSGYSPDIVTGYTAGPSNATPIADVLSNSDLVLQGTVLYTVTATDVTNLCQSVATVITQTVNATPSLLTGIPVLCVAGTQITLSDMALGGIWTSSNGSASVGPATGAVTQNTAGTPTITYAVGSDINLCQVTAVLTINATPTPIAGNLNLCVSGAATFLSDGSVGGTWTSGTPATAIIDVNSGQITPVSGVLSTTLITYANGLGAGCATMATATVNPLPNTPTASGTGTYCGSTTVTATLIGSGTIYFEGTNNSGTSVLQPYNPALPPVVSYTGPYGLAENNTYYFRARSAAGCWGGSGSVGVTLDPLPTAYNVTGGGTYCSGFSSTLHVGLQSSQPLSANITYELWFNGAATGTTLTGTGGPLDFGIQSAAGSYAVVATSPTPCTTSMSGTVTVVVSPVPNIYTVTGGGGYCLGGVGVPVGLNGSDPGITYQLYLNGVAFGALVPGHSDGSAIDFGTDLGIITGFTTGLYTVKANPGSACEQTMTGSASVVVNPAPAIYTFSGGGTRCASDAGFDLALSSSQLGVDYQLFNSITGPVGSPKPGTGFELVYAGQTAAGVYSVEGINTTSSCPNTMSGTGTIIVHALPTALLMSAGNSYCAGGTGVDVSVVVTGVQVTDPLVSYQLLRNGFPVSGAAQNGNGTGGLDFGLQTLAGTYTVYATNTSTGCSNTMSGSTVVSVNTLPTVYNVTGGGSYCNGGSGVAVGLNFTGSGINYQLYDQFGPVGFLQSGTGAAISFGLETAVLGTTYSYSVVATDATTSCHSNMNGSAGVSVNPLPVNTFVVGGGGNYCVGGAGVDVSLGGSAPAVSYQLLYNGAASGSPLVGGSPLDFGLQTGLGTYKVQATDQSTLCTSTMTTSVNVGTNPLPALFTVTGGGTRCATDPGVAIGLNNSATAAVNYKLYNGATLMSTVAGTSGVLGFPVQTAAGVYTVVADDGTCTRTMSGSATIVVNAPPTAYNVTGGGSLCTGGTGAVVSLSGSDLGISYQLKLNGTSTGTPVSGTGFGISFGAQTGNGAYTAGAINTATGCSAMMSNTATVTVNTPPTAYAVTGGGGYCPGGSGRHVGLFASQAGTLGVTYQLYLNGSPVSGAVINNLSGTAALDFGLQTGVGTYTIGASDNATGCTDVMSGSVSIFINTPPTAYTVTGGGNYCPPPQGSGVDVSLGGSTLNVSYQLYAAGVAVPGAPTIGTGFAIDFGQQATVGNYTVKGTDPSTGCIATMSSSVNVGLNSLPVAYTLSGTNSYCLGGSGVDITLGGTELHTNYQLFRGGSPVGSPVAGSGFAYDFGNQTSPSGTVVYTAAAINTITGCTNGMLGTPSVTVNPLPVAYTVTGGGSYCFGGTGLHVGLSTTDAGISYQLLRNNIPVGAAVTPGATINYDFGAQLLAGTYTVGATNSVTGCINTMLGSAVISINPLPTAYLVTGGGGYCVGGTGVHVGLSGSVTGTTYQLYNGTGNVGGAIAGTGSSIDFGPELASVTNYSVTATATATGCSNTMSGSANVFTNPLPTVYALGGGGSYCSGGTGVHVMLGGSQTGVNYQLYNGSTLEGGLAGGTGSGLDFGLQTALGTYSVSAVNAVTGCVSAMTSTVTVSTTPLPTVYNVTGTGSYCFSGSGIVPGLSHSDIGISYQLYLNSTAEGAAVPGTGSAISFTSQTIAGTYTVLATNITTACTNGMNGGAAISINPLPAAYSVTGGGHYCQGGTGVHVGLSASATGISYQLYNGSVATGTAVIGTGSGIDFGLQTAGGTYSVTATNATTGCSAGMNSFATVTVDPLPTVYTISGGGGYCAGGSGLDITLGGSQIGISYQLYLNGIANGTAAAGTGTVLDYGLRTVAGTYTIIANNTGTGCTLSMGSSAVVVVNPLPAVYAMSGGGSYCAGGSGVHIGLANSNTGINYQLYSGIVPEGTAVAGTGAAIDFGLTGAAGTYTVLATDASTGCTKEMSGAESVGINGLPVVYNVTGGGSYCAGGAGVHIGLSGSEFGLSYQLYKAGAPWGVAVSGTGGTLDFGLQTVSGSYSVITTNPATSCTNTMSGSASVSINPLPAVYSVSGGGGYCAGGNGIAVGLNNSHTGINYQLYANGAAAGGAVAGTGSAISFGLQTAGGTYSVTATDATSGCSNAMGGSATVTVNPLPTVYNVTGGGSYCLGGAGMHVGLSGSATGISYQLYNNSGAVGGLTAGTGSALDFGLQATAGTYSVTAANVPTGCVNNMSGNVTVSVNNPPLAHNVTGSGSYCAGSAGPDLQLDGSEGGVNYSLYNGSSLVSTVAGGGGIVDFGPQAAAGTYSVSAVNATTGCSANMNGSATVALNPLPVAHNVTGGGSYCLGGSGVHVGLDGSATGINYKLYNGGTLESTKAGTGSAIDFGLQAAAGTYTVTAADGITNCARQMSGSVVVTINALPTAHNVTNTGSAYCAGGAGITIGLDASDAGIRYQLYDGSAAVGGAVSGGGTINFGPQLGAGTYSVSATNTISGCSAGMSGSATFSVTPLAAVYPVTGGGSYCQGAGGVDVAMGMSDGSVVYELFNGTTPVVALNGTGGVLDFLQQQAGSYTVVAFIGVCSDTMAGTAVVTENPLPTLYNVTGGGGYCLGGAGVSLGVDNSDVGTSYQLYLGSSPSGAAVSGTGHGISFGLRTGTGFYGVIATNNATGCTNTMNNTPLVSTNTPPVVFNVTGGGGYCAGTAGVAVGLDGSENGTTYNLYRGSVMVATATGGGIAFSFPLQAAGTYSVQATNGCSSNMAGSATATQNTLPGNYAVTGGGHYCASGTGIAVGLGGSAIGISYQLSNSAGTIGSAINGTGSAISFGVQTAQDVYSVTAANNTTGCSSVMGNSVSIVIDALPVAQPVNGGGSYCLGGAGVDISTGGSQAGIRYQLYLGSVSTATVTATGTAGVDFGNQAAAGTYVVTATDPASHCVNNMTGSVVVGINPLPTAYNLGGSASNYCAGGNGVDITLNNSQSTVSYQLYNGAGPVGAAIPGSGSSLDFGMQLAQGTYHVVGTDNTTGCSNMMSGTPVIVIDPLPAAYAVTGGGSYCAGSAGVHIGLAGSQAGIRYDLYAGSVIEASRTGTGGTLDFGAQTVAGTYIVMAANTTTLCTSQMAGTAVVTANALPTSYAVAGGGSYCAGGSGADIALAGSQSGVTYQLYNGSLPTGGAVSGTGSPIDFGVHTGAGNYTVTGTNTATGCTNNMSGSAVINVLSAPVVFTVTGGGSYCNGGGGVHIGLSGSATGVSYRLYNGATPSGGAVSGTGSGLDFGLQTAAGSYTVVATNVSSGGCSINMNGSAVVTINALPAVYHVTGGGSYCSGTGGVHVGLNNSATGISYQLYMNGSTVGAAVNGTGHALDFGAQLAPGAYSVYAQDNTTTCTDNMLDTVTISVTPTVVPSVTILSTPGDTVCAGTNVSFALLGANAGTAPVYNWTVNGLSVSVLNNYNYVPDSGDVVTLTMTSSAACATPATVTSSVTMTVNTNVVPVVTVSADLGDTVCSGTRVNYTATGVYGGTPSYTWMVNGATVGTGTTYGYAPQLGDVIVCMMNSTYPCRTANTVFSTPITMAIDTPVTPIVVITASPGTRIAQGQADTLTAVVPPSISGLITVSYQWLINGNPVPGATNPVFVNSNYVNGDSVTVQVTATTPCGSAATFNSVIIHVGTTGVTVVSGAAGNITLIPNPNKGDFSIRGTLGSAEDQEVSLEITDVLGQVIYKSKVMARGGVVDELIHLDKTVANGMYMLTLKSATDNKVFHVVIEQ